MPGKKLSEKPVYDLGVAVKGKKVLLFHNLFHHDNPFRIAVSLNGINFKRFSKNPVIKNIAGEGENTLNCKDFHISQLDSKYVLIYKSENNEKKVLSLALSSDLINWQKIGEVSKVKELGMVVPNYDYEDNYVLYFGEDEIKIAFSKDLGKWTAEETVLERRSGCFDDSPLGLVSVITKDRGIAVIYFVKKKKGRKTVNALGIALFDRKDPLRILYRSENPVWEIENEEDSYPLGAVEFNKNLIVYFAVEGKGVFAVSFSGSLIFTKTPSLDKFDKNPIIEPVLEHLWENQATFNTAAVLVDGKVHFVYRAIGFRDTSVLGYASSLDGVHIDERLKDPIYMPTEPFELPYYASKVFSSYASGGGGYGGCEDPRITKIQDKLYMTYVAHNGIDPPRVALTSIKVDDFVNKQWNFKKPKLISPPGIVDKNACLFPEKINGKYVILHRIFPDILIDFLDNLDFENSYLHGEFAIKPRNGFWDSRKIGAGAPPIKTKDGWLLIYHAVDDKDSSRYKIGAMLLDLYNPTEVVVRSHSPILEPTEWYENEGFKWGVAYPCAAIVFEDDLIVYYGGADRVVCAARKNLDAFLGELESQNNVKLEALPQRQVLVSYD